ncbi:MAG TPA: hypothetical protein VGO63_02665 [Candidatus Paceibacterota bacterium]|jgi:hypothetical protein|nr:hypothetical protein [Candidatus Paceibacterota bacterium]
MIYLFTGDDIKRKLPAYEKFIKSVFKGTEKFFINRNDFNPVQIESFYSGAGLFFKKSALVFSNILETESEREFVLKKLQLMADSGNDFIFSERKLNKSILDAFKKAKAELYVFELPKEKKEKFNSFLLANAFGAKDKLNLWIYYRQAMDKGVELEELIGVLFWKAKDMFLKNNFGKFSPEQIKNFTEKLPYLLPEARKTGHDAEIAFEQFLLEAF